MTILHAVRRAVSLPCFAWMCHVSPIKPVKKQAWALTTIAIVTTVVSIALSVAAAAVQYMQQQAAAEANARNQAAQMKAQDDAIAQNAALATRAYMDQTKSTQERQRQVEEQAINRELGVSVDAAKARSTALTAAGESGVSGLSVNALLSDFTRQEVDYRFQSQTQVGYERDQVERELENARLTAEGRGQSMKPYQAQPVQYPSLLGAGLRVGAEAGSKALSAYQNMPQTPGQNQPFAATGSSAYQDYRAGERGSWK